MQFVKKWRRSGRNGSTIRSSMIQSLLTVMVGLYCLSISKPASANSICLMVDRYFDEFTLGPDLRPITHESVTYSHYTWSISGRRDDHRMCVPHWYTGNDKFMCDWTLLQVVVYYDQNFLGFPLKRSIRKSITMTDHDSLKQITCGW